MATNNVVTVTQGTLSNILDTLLSIKTLTPFIWGGPGIGKSTIVRNLAMKNGLNFVDIRLSMMDPVSLMGVMVPNIKDGTTNWLPPSFFNTDKPTLFFFDELNSAPQSIQAAAYQIILDRKIGQHSLKETDFVVAAGNNVNEGITFKMPAPLANRFIHLNLSVSFDDFFVYAIKNKFHQHVVGYLNYQKGDLYLPNFSVPDIKGFPTPRSWEFVSKILYKADEMQLSTELLIPMISGAIGEGVAYKFISYRRIAETLTNIDEIITGKIKVMKPKNIDESYALVTALCSSLSEEYSKYKNNKIKKEVYDKYCDNFMGFFLNPANEIQPEMVIMAARTVLTAFDIDIDVDLPQWDKFFRNDKFSRPIREAFTGLDKKVANN